MKDITGCAQPEGSEGKRVCCINEFDSAHVELLCVLKVWYLQYTVQSANLNMCSPEFPHELVTMLYH